MDNMMDAEMEPELNTYVWGVQGKGLLEFNRVFWYYTRSLKG